MWIRDGEVVSGIGLQNSSRRSTQTSGTGLYAGSTLVVKSLNFTGHNALDQGYYWCRVKDTSNQIVESSRSLIRFKGNGYSHDIRLFRKGVICDG